MTTIRQKINISKPQKLAITTVAPSPNHSPLHDLEIAPRKHAILDEASVSHLRPIHHLLPFLQKLDPETVPLARPTARSLPTVLDAGGANVLEGSGPISLRHSNLSGSSGLPRRSSPPKAIEHSLKVKTSFHHSVDTSPFSTPQPFALTAPPVFSDIPVAIQSVTVRAPEADTGESTSPNAEEQHPLECGSAGAPLATADAAQEDSSSVFEEADFDGFLSSDAELIEPDRSHSSSANGAESSADETNTPIFVSIAVHAFRRRERVASVEGDIPEEDDEHAEDYEDEIGEASPYRQPTTTQPKDIPKPRQPCRHVNARIDSGNVPDADMALSTGPLSALQLMSPLFRSRSSSVFSYGDSYADANRRHSHEITRTCTDENTRQLTHCDSAAARHRASSVSRGLLQLPELRRTGRRRSETVSPACPLTLPPAIANGLGVALMYRSSPTFRKMWARYPSALSYSVPPTPNHVRSECELENDFFSDSLNGASGKPDGRTSAPPFGQPQSRQSSVFRGAASGLRSRDQLGGQVLSERDLASPPARNSIVSKMISTADTIDSSSSSSSFRLSRHFSFNVKHTGLLSSSLPPQAQQHRRGSVCIPLEKN